jgi:hypothetical protein
MKRYNEFKNNTSLNVFFGQLMGIRTQAHLLHLSTKSYAQHKALGSFYEDIVGLLDKMIETYQGQYGIVSIETETYKEKDPIVLLNSFAKDIDQAKNSIDEKDSHLLNIIDEIAALNYQTLYKLKNLS